MPVLQRVRQALTSCVSSPEKHEEHASQPSSVSASTLSSGSSETPNPHHASLLRKDLEQDLMNRFHENNEKFKPLLELLMATRKPASDPEREAAVQDAISRIEADNQKHAPPPTDTPVVVAPPKFERSADVHEADGQGALFASDIAFQNWGHTVANTPSTTWQIRTKKGIQGVVKWAAKQDRRVRVAGFRHSWTDIFGANGDVIIMLAPYSSLVDLPYKAPEWWDSDLNVVSDPIPSVGPQQRVAEAGHAFYRIGAGVVNEDFRKWCFEHKKVCLPLSVIMVEVTFGGTNAPVCHGAGLGTKTLSDLVVEVEYVDAKGELQVVNDPEELKVASGCFGLLGVVTSLVLQLEDMHVALLHPTKQHLILAIPPPESYSIPVEVQEMMNADDITKEMLDKARKDFVRRCEEDYYLEWFWFPYQTDCWVNTWKRHLATPEEKPVIKSYPDNNLFTGAQAQALQGTIAQHVLNWKIWKAVPGHLQAYWFGLASMAALPAIDTNGDDIKALQSDALHFRRGIQNFRVRDTEWEIPIPGKGGKRDYETIQRAWWDAISAMYADKEAPVRIALEMRLTGGSDILLAPQRGNDVAASNRFGSISIEVLTTVTTDRALWDAFKERVANAWTSYVDPESGEKLVARPHWAKEWQGIKVQGVDVQSYLKGAYGGVIPLFREGFEKIVGARNGSVDETRARFGNDMMNGLIWG